MNDLLIKVSKRSRLIDLDHSTLGIVGENLQEKLIFTFQDEFVDGMARLEYELNGEKRYVLMEKVGQSYILPVQNVLLTKEGNIDLQLVITEDKTGTPVFKSEVFTLYCKKSIEAVGEAPSSYELWIETANRILLEASRVNINGQKTGNETTIEIIRRSGEKKVFKILDGKDGENGEDGNGIVSIEKTSTSGLVDTYTITFTDGTTTTYTVTNGETQDLSNYVQKTEFNTSQAEQDDTIEGLQAELERYKLLENALPHTENVTPSDYVTLNNTAKSPMEIETIPQTSQETTTGKNLFNKYSSSNTGTSGLEKTVLNADGQIVSTSNYGTNRSKGFTIENLEQNTDYILSGELISANGTNQRNALVQILSFTNSTIKSNYFESSITKPYSFDFTFNTGENSSVWISFNGWGLLQDSSLPTTIFDNIQIEKGNSATSYEPYTGGIPAPNPDYPEDIHCTTGENVVKVVGKNIFNKVLYQGGINENTGEETSSNYVVRTDFIKVANNENYTLSFEYINVSNYNVLIAEYDSEQSFVKSTRSINRNVSSIVSNNRTSYLRISFYSDARPTPATFDNFFEEVQLENNSTATSYLPYESTTYPISLGNKEMFNINDVYDGFVYDESVDKFYIERFLKRIIFNGEENWTASTNVYYVTTLIDYKVSDNIPMSNYFRGVSNVSGAGGIFNIPDDNICAFISQPGSVTPRFYIKALTLGDLTAFKSWLSTHNTTVVYQLATSTLEEITDTTLISQLRAIKNALSMQGTTHIISTATGENLPFLIKARAVQTIERT